MRRQLAEEARKLDLFARDYELTKYAAKKTRAFEDASDEEARKGATVRKGLR